MGYIFIISSHHMYKTNADIIENTKLSKHNYNVYKLSDLRLKIIICNHTVFIDISVITKMHNDDC